MEDELAQRRERKNPYATPMGQDIIDGALPLAHQYKGVTYKSTSGITVQDVEYLVEWVEEVAEGVQWGVMFLGDGEGPELSDVWGLTSVWVADGGVCAVLAGVTGPGIPCPAPVMLRTDAPNDAIRMLEDAHSAAMDALSHAANYT